MIQIIITVTAHKFCYIYSIYHADTMNSAYDNYWGKKNKIIWVILSYPSSLYRVRVTVRVIMLT